MELKTVIAALRRLDERDVLNLCGQFHNVTENLVKYFKKMGYEIRSEDGYGGSGLGEEYWGVFSLSNERGITYYKIPGFHTSYTEERVYPEETVIVKPIQVRAWEKK